MVHLKIKIKIKPYTWQLKKDTSSSDLYIVSSTKSWKGVYLSNFFQFQNNNNNNNNNIVNTKNKRTNSEFTYEQQHALLVDPSFLFIKTSQHELRESLEDEDPFLYFSEKDPFLYLFIHNDRTRTEIALKRILFNWADQIGRPNHKLFTHRNSIKADTM